MFRSSIVSSRMNAPEPRATASLAAAFAPGMRGHTVFPMRAGVAAAWRAIAFVHEAAAGSNPSDLEVLQYSNRLTSG